MPLPVHIRVATHADVEAMVELQRESGRPAHPEPLRRAIEDVGRLVVVALAGSEVAGWAKTHRFDDDDGPALAGEYLGGVEVSVDWRRRGVATALTDARLRWIAARADRAWYVVNASNGASLELHRRFGFVEVARAPSFHGTTFTGGCGVLLRADLSG